MPPVQTAGPIELAVFDVPHVNASLHLPRPLNRGSFFHAAYRAEGLLGKAILQTHPYSLFPPRSYFAGFTISANSLTCSRVHPR